MPLPNNTRVATYRFGEGSLRLQASFARLEALKDMTGTPAFQYIMDGMNMDEPDEMIERILNIFLCLQADVEEHTKAAIADWLFGSFVDFFTTDNLMELQIVFSAILGEDLRAKMEEAAAETKAPATKKKPANSTNSKQLPAT